MTSSNRDGKKFIQVKEVKTCPITQVATDLALQLPEISASTKKQEFFTSTMIPELWPRMNPQVTSTVWEELVATAKCYKAAMHLALKQSGNDNGNNHSHGPRKPLQQHPSSIVPHTKYIQLTKFLPPLL